MTDDPKQLDADMNALARKIELGIGSSAASREEAYAALDALLAVAKEARAQDDALDRAYQSRDDWRAEAESARKAERERDEALLCIEHERNLSSSQADETIKWRKRAENAERKRDEWQRYAERLREALYDLLVVGDDPSSLTKADKALALPSPAAPPEEWTFTHGGTTSEGGFVAPPERKKP